MNTLKLILILFLLAPIAVVAQNYTWTQQTSATSSQLTEMYFVSDYEGFAAGNGGAMMRTVNGGANWDFVNTPVTTANIGLHFEDMNTGMISENFGETYRTTDGGFTWQLVYDHAGVMNSVTFNNGRYFGGCSSEMLFSDDYGDTWDSLAMPIFGSIKGISFSGNSVGYAVNAGISVAKTTDNGETWLDIGDVTISPYDLNDIHAVTEDIVIGVGDSGTIVRSINGGTTWSLIPITTNNGFYNVDFADDTYGLATGTNNLVYETTDGGATWSPTPTGNGGHIFGISCRSNQLAYVCGQSGKTYRSPAGNEDIFTSTYTGPSTVCVGSLFDFSFEFENVGTGPSFDPSFTVQESSGVNFTDTTIIHQGTVYGGDLVEMIVPGVQLNYLGTYTIIITSTDSINQANNTLIIPIEVVAPDAHDVTGGTYFCPGQAIVIEATGGNSYKWTGGITSDLTNPVQTVYPQVTTLYSVEITQDYCVVEDSVWLNLEPNCQPDDMTGNFLAFSPNFDGVNDYLYLDFLDPLSDQNAVAIYNRWGDLIFDTPNYDNDNNHWDGTFSGRQSPPGTYFLIAETGGGDFIKTWVQLVK